MHDLDSFGENAKMLKKINTIIAACDDKLKIHMWRNEQCCASTHCTQYMVLWHIVQQCLLSSLRRQFCLDCLCTHQDHESQGGKGIMILVY